MGEDMKDRQDETQDLMGRALGRRELLKLGAGVVGTALGVANAAAQGGGDARPVPAPGSVRKPGVPRPHTGTGYKYTANRLGNNGPMDDTSRQIVKFVAEFNESKLTEPVVYAINRTMVDSMACCISSFETEPARIAAKVARHASPNALKSTVLGYGITTTPELAAFANGVLVRETDMNDNPHTSNVIPGVLAVAEALHSTGAQTMAAICIAYEMATIGAGESIGPAMGAGKLMGLDEDRLANALSIALTPHVALNKGVGIMSMWKGVRSAEATKCGIWAAILARDGMTGPPQPFEGRGAFWSLSGRREFVLPEKEKLAIQRNWFKRRPGVASSQEMLDKIVPEVRKWTTLDEIDWIQVDTEEMGESTDNPKWDPPNQQTADHSRPYLLARALIDGDIWLDSFTEDKLRDPALRGLLARISFGQVQGWSGNGVMHMVVRKKDGEQRTWDTFGGIRVRGEPEDPHLTDEEISQKFDRISEFHKVNTAQRDRAKKIWGNLREVKDIGEAIQTLAKFGQPKPLDT